MPNPTPEGEAGIADLARRHGVSAEAVTTLLEAIVKGNGTSAQFDHPELGGMGQWMRGGMTQVGDMFNSALRARVESLCAELAALLAASPSIVEAAPDRMGRASASSGEQGRWWPPELGTPGATGSQNQARYAYFPGTRRLAVEVHGTLTVYDTQEHQIQGVSQQQGTGDSLTFTSQMGRVDTSQLPVVHRSSRQ